MHFDILLRLLAVVLFIGPIGCASTFTFSEEDPQTTAKLDLLYAHAQAGDPSLILELSPEAKTELDRIVQPTWPDRLKFETLRRHLFDIEGLDIAYDAVATKTAAETYTTRTGNCISLSNLFISAARYIGIDAHFQTVTVAPTWDQEGSTMIRYEHIVAVGELRPHDEYVVDFLPGFTLDDEKSQRISDEQALALYYNNLGAESVVHGNPESAIGYLHKALKIWPENSEIWGNLGAAYRRTGDKLLAEQIYIRALNINRNNYSALANLSKLYLANNREAEAVLFLERVDRYYRKNPYFLYYVARLHYNENNYDESIAYLQGAIKLKDDEESFYYAISQAHRKLGQVDIADNYLAQATQIESGVSRLVRRQAGQSGRDAVWLRTR